MAKISVIIPVYNRQHIIERTIKSVFNQSYKNWECIIIDDGSIDNTFSVLERIKKTDKRIKLLKRDREPKGAPTCRNIGLQKSNADYVMFLDSDDILMSYCLQQRMDFISRSFKFDFFVFPVFIKNNGVFKYYVNPDKNQQLEALLTFKSVWQSSSVIWNRNVITDLNGWDESLKIRQDVELHFRAILRTNNFKIVDILPDVFYRTNMSDSITTQKNHSRLTEILKMKKTIYEQLPQELISNYRKSIKSMLYNEIEQSDGMNSKVILDSEEQLIKLFLTELELKQLKQYLNLKNWLNKYPVIRGIFYRLRTYGIVYPKREIFFITYKVPESYESRIVMDKNYKLVK